MAAAGHPLPLAKFVPYLLASIGIEYDGFVTLVATRLEPISLMNSSTIYLPMKLTCTTIMTPVSLTMRCLQITQPNLLLPHVFKVLTVVETTLGLVMDAVTSELEVPFPVTLAIIFLHLLITV